MPSDIHPDITHTPGPWRMDESVGGSLYVVSGDASQHDLAVMTDTWRRGNWAEARANARLMAAAPALLAAIEQYLAVDNAEALRVAIQTHGGFSGYLADLRTTGDALRAVIANAKGETIA